MEQQTTPTLWSLSKYGCCLTGLCYITWLIVMSLKGDVLANPGIILIALLFSMILSMACVFLADLSTMLSNFCCWAFTPKTTRPPKIHA